MFERILIIGIGLIGGSLSKSIKKHNLAKKILACDLNRESLEFALKEDIIDEIYEFDFSLKKGDLIIISSPLASYESIFNKLYNNIDENVIISDIGSVKFFIEDKILPKFPKINFISCHPIAGSEKTGVKNAISDLFLDKKVVIINNKNERNLAKITNFWREIGSIVSFTDAKEHDQIFAFTSHLPQFISHFCKESFLNEDINNIKNSLISKHLRLQSSCNKIWSDIFKFNYHYINKYLDEYIDNINKITDFLEKDDFIAIIDLILMLKNKDIIDQEQMKIELNNEILVQIFTILPFISISDAKSFKEYFGSGFKDFTIILNIIFSRLDDEESLIDLIFRNKSVILKTLSQLKNVKNEFRRYKTL